MGTVMRPVKEPIPSLGSGSAEAANLDTFLEVGQKYLIQTATTIFVGKLVAQNATELKLDNCLTFPYKFDSIEYLLGRGFDDLSPYADPVIVFRAAIVDCIVCRHDLPTE